MPAKAHKPTDKLRKMVKDYSAVGTPQDDIAKVIGIDRNTLAKHYREELDTAATKANAAVAGKLYSQCMAGNTSAMIFWLKTRARWRETDNNVTVVAEKISSITYVGEDASKPQ